MIKFTKCSDMERNKKKQEIVAETPFVTYPSIIGLTQIMNLSNLNYWLHSWLFFVIVLFIYANDKIK